MAHLHVMAATVHTREITLTTDAKRPLGPHRRSGRNLPTQHPTTRRPRLQESPPTRLPSQQSITTPPTRFRRPRRPRSRHRKGRRPSQDRQVQRIRLLWRRQFLPPRHPGPLGRPHMRLSEDDTRHIRLHGRRRIASRGRGQAVGISASPPDARPFAYSEIPHLPRPSLAGYA